jgi:hypothetical protein
MDYIVRAIHSLRPGSEFSFTENDYSTIKWDVLDGEPPTQSEIDAEIEQIKIKDTQQNQQKELDKLELLGKLGITEDEFKLLFS